MPTLVFVIMYIAGVLLAFTGKSLFPFVRLPLILRIPMFLKVRKTRIAAHILLYQVFTLLSYGTMVYLFISDASSDIVMIYNIYVRVSFTVLAFMLVVSAVDAHLIEKGAYGRNNDENN